MLFVLLLGCDSEDEDVCPTETGGDPGAFKVDADFDGSVGVAVLDQLEVFHSYDDLNAWWMSAQEVDVVEMDFTNAQAVGMVTEWANDETPTKGVRIDSFVWSAGGAPPILARMERECMRDATHYSALWEVWSTPVADVEVCTLERECDSGGDAD